ncbi:centrosomal protein of 290 kDa [Anoplophora glabripennis]|uniref:centrosomal protein of 290 kDa n=1 Tax=Anoplophora glabripennis TaxID=217634 RepID=UPI000873A1F5|nr:centrosomal protein of 290 kDa [Anoplophora glabripennis]
MDWDHILALTPEDLDDDEKDELYNTVTWFECDGDDVDLTKCKVLLRVSQEILKYKGEQVEALLHELEEVAVKQGEEEAVGRMESDTRSSRSRKSSSIELENLELKYLELKGKYKKTMKINEKNTAEINKLTNTIKILERENKNLQNEVQAKSHETASESDISENIKDQQKELMQTVQNKNKQISELLGDIEVVEKENFILRGKLSNVRDELSLATKEISTMTEILKAKEAAIEENEGNESLKKISAQYDILQEEFEELEQLKKNMEQEMKDFVAEVDTRVDQWKQILDQKDAEIQELKSRNHQPSLNSSLSSLPNDEIEKSQVNALQRSLSEREKQLMEVQIQLQVATKEMEENTEILRNLKEERDKDVNKLKELYQTVKNLKKQLKAVHERCQNLQEEVTYAEKTSASKDAELKDILDKMHENGQVDLVVQVKELQDLKTENRIKEKQIMNLVKTSNKLQENCDLYEKENEVLRTKLGMSEDEQLNLSGFAAKQSKHKKELEVLKKKLTKMEEEKLSLKSETQKLNRMLSSLTDQILELGHKPIYDNVTERKPISVDLKNENKALVDENEALRKGMHEILNSINVKKGSSLNEIKSETFEKLLRALDVKHISGWYHPAMRLQAELHNLEGINAELREQLREVRVEAEKYKSMEEKAATVHGKDEADEVEEKEKSDEPDITQPKEESDIKESEDYNIIDITNLDDLKENLVQLFDKSGENFKTITNLDYIYLEKELVQIQRKTLVIFNALLNEKVKLENELKSNEERLKVIEDKCELSESKLKVLEENETDEAKLKKLEEIVSDNVVLKRKVIYLEDDSNKLTKKLEELKIDLSNSQSEHIKKIGELSRANITLEKNLAILKNLNETSVDYEAFEDLRKTLDGITIKYRELSSNIKKDNEEKCAEIKMLQESQKTFEKDKAELKKKLVEVLSKLSLQSVQDVDDKMEKHSQKLAECEVNEITERQRANHTNNLYELVKEQFNKSEERFQEYSKYNEDLLKKNLVLQEQLKEAEHNLCNYIDRASYKQLQTVNNDLVRQNEKLEVLNSKLEEDLKLAKQSFNNQQMWNNCKEQELLHLKHQVVDLVSASDEKMIIAQLNSDLLHCRQSENVYKTRLDEAEEELKSTKEELERNTTKYEQEKLEAEEKEVQLNKKIKVLQELLCKQKQQYLGSIPLCSEEIYLENLRSINKEKHETFLHLHRTKMLEAENEILKEQLEIELQDVTMQKQMIIEGDKEEFKKALNWMQEKKTLQINELRYKRQSEFKEAQLQHFMDRVKMQDEQISKLDEELLLWHKNFDVNLPPKKTSVEEETLQIPSLKSELIKVREVVDEKQRNIDQLKSKITELEMTISLFRKQIGDKQSQITFYERHIMELQGKRDEVHSGGAGGDNLSVGMESSKSNDEIISLKASIQSLQDSLKSKEEEIIKYQTLLKVDRDKHSLAAARLQEELQTLQLALTEEKQKCLSLKETFSRSRPNRAALEQYMTQVHALEKHTAELHTKITTLEAQLQSSRQEAVRWRSLANDRLDAMEELRNDLEEQHKNELSVYKTDSEKLKELGNDDKNNLLQLIMKYKSESSGQISADIGRLIREKDDKIHELTVKLRQTKNEAKRFPAAEKLETSTSPKLNDLESSVELLSKENELHKKRYEQLLNKERSAREEIRDLKAQLLRKPSAARTDKSEKTIKDQLQRKISSLENEMADLKQNLAEQISINEGHRVQASEDFDKWKKMKHWQQSAEKLKNKLKERDNEFEKLQQTCSGYRLLIERLEREKHNLENRVKNLKSSNASAVGVREVEVLRIENMRLQAEIEAVSSRLEMQQHHAGGLGAAMMQEKLEGQERKIAILELTAKGSAEVRAELERLQDTVSNLQKRNLCLEAENLDLKLDLEKSNKEIPHFHQQIQHLENYVDVLKSENTKRDLDTLPCSSQPTNEPKRVSELERTVFILKRVVEKLQAENKRLLTGKRPLSDRSPSGDKLKRDYARLKEQYGESLQKIGLLERQLANRNEAKNMLKKPDDALSDELAKVKEELEQKSHLLEKVKVLLHRAAAKEKSLLQEIAELRSQKEAGISPIPEESEDSSEI